MCKKTVTTLSKNFLELSIYIKKENLSIVSPLSQLFDYVYTYLFRLWWNNQTFSCTVNCLFKNKTLRICPVSPIIFTRQTSDHLRSFPRWLTASLRLRWLYHYSINGESIWNYEEIDLSRIVLLRLVKWGQLIRPKMQLLLKLILHTYLDVRRDIYR